MAGPVGVAVEQQGVGEISPQAMIRGRKFDGLAEHPGSLSEPAAVIESSPDVRVGGLPRLDGEGARQRLGRPVEVADEKVCDAEVVQRARIVGLEAVPAGRTRLPPARALAGTGGFRTPCATPHSWAATRWRASALPPPRADGCRLPAPRRVQSARRGTRARWQARDDRPLRLPQRCRSPGEGCRPLHALHMPWRPAPAPARMIPRRGRRAPAPARAGNARRAPGRAPPARAQSLVL